MIRLWGKVFKDNRMLQDAVICDESDDTRTHKIFHALHISITYDEAHVVLIHYGKSSHN